MAITGAEDAIVVGGDYSLGGTADGDYRVKVNSVGIGTASTGTKQLTMEFFGKGDPDHPAKEGKFVFKMYQSLPSEKQDAEKRKQTQGFLKRLVYDGFGFDWPKTGKKFDARMFADKECWIRIKKREGKDRPEIVAIALERDNLPATKGAAGTTNAKEANAGATRRR